MSEPAAPSHCNASHCAVREQTGDGVYVGRCWFHSPNDICPRHGDISVVQSNFRETGQLGEDPREAKDLLSSTFSEPTERVSPRRAIFRFLSTSVFVLLLISWAVLILATDR